MVPRKQAPYEVGVNGIETPPRHQPRAGEGGGLEFQFIEAGCRSTETIFEIPFFSIVIP